MNYKPGSVCCRKSTAWMPSILRFCYQNRLAVYPRRRKGHSCRCLTLLLARLAVPFSLLKTRWSLTPPFHPYPTTCVFPFGGKWSGGLFSAALSVREIPARELPGAMPFGARTFLGKSFLLPRHPIHRLIIT